MKKSAVFVCILALTFIASLMTFSLSSAAVMLQVDASGQLIGAKEVNVLGTLYDVEFVLGTCLDIFGCELNSAFTFDTQSSAGAASQALLDQVLLDVPEGNFDSNPSLVDSIGEGILTPFGYVWNPVALDYEVLTVDAINSALESEDRVAYNEPHAITWDHTYALWTPSTIPEPSTLLLLGSGLCGLCAFRKKIRK